MRGCWAQDRFKLPRIPHGKNSGSEFFHSQAFSWLSAQSNTITSVPTEHKQSLDILWPFWNPSVLWSLWNLSQVNETSNSRVPAALPDYWLICILLVSSLRFSLCFPLEQKAPRSTLEGAGEQPAEVREQEAEHAEVCAVPESFLHHHVWLNSVLDYKETSQGLALGLAAGRADCRTAAIGV